MAQSHGRISYFAYWRVALVEVEEQMAGFNGKYLPIWVNGKNNYLPKSKRIVGKIQ